MEQELVPLHGPVLDAVLVLDAEVRYPHVFYPEEGHLMIIIMIMRKRKGEFPLKCDGAGIRGKLVFSVDPGSCLDIVIKVVFRRERMTK